MADDVQTDVRADVVVDNQSSIATDDSGIVSLDDVTAEAAADEDEGRAPEQEAASDEEQDTGEIETGDNEGEDADGDAGDDEAEAEGDDSEMLEFDFGGNKLEVPKDAVPPELATKIDEFTKGTWSAFTKGQQENVERAQALEVRESTVAKLNTLNGEALQTYSYGLTLRSEIEQLSQVDMNSLWQSDPDRARQISDLLGSKQAEFQQVLAKVGEQERAVEEAQLADVNRRIDEGSTYLDKHIKNFTSEKAPELVKYVVETYGMPADQAERWALNPVVTRMAYKAMLFDRQTGSVKRAAARPVQAKPVKSVASSGAATGGERNPDNMSMGRLAKYLDLNAA